MTLQYIAGELSLILGELEAAVPSRAARRQVAGLRREAETAAFPALPAVAARALRLTDDACWAALTRGDAGSFRREASISAELWSFGLCACLLDEAPPTEGQAPGSAHRRDKRLDERPPR
jgi:hypothetical protein